jgi:hypothetical protein
MPPPSSGGVHLIQMLNILETWPLAELGGTTARPRIHRMAEAMKLAYADRSEYLGDPDFIKVPVAGLTSKAYAKELAARIDPNRARPGYRNQAWSAATPRKRADHALFGGGPGRQRRRRDLYAEFRLRLRHRRRRHRHPAQQRDGRLRRQTGRAERLRTDRRRRQRGWPRQAPAQLDDSRPWCSRMARWRWSPAVPAAAASSPPCCKSC